MGIIMKSLELEISDQTGYVWVWNRLTQQRWVVLSQTKVCSITWITTNNIRANSILWRVSPIWMRSNSGASVIPRRLKVKTMLFTLCLAKIDKADSKYLDDIVTSLRLENSFLTAGRAFTFLPSHKRRQRAIQNRSLWAKGASSSIFSLDKWRDVHT